MLDTFRMFFKVVELGSFSKAAKQSYVSQSTVTKQMQALEKTAGYPLFVRNRDGATLTAAGQVLYRELQGACAAVDAAFEAGRSEAQLHRYDLRVGVIDEYMNVPPIILRAGETYEGVHPGCQLEYVKSSNATFQDDLLQKRFDVVFYICDTGRTPEALHHRTLYDCPVAFYVPPNHRLATAQSVSLRDLDGERCKTPFNPDARVMGDLAALLREAGASMNIEFYGGRTSNSSVMADLRRGYIYLLLGIWTNLTTVSIDVPEIACLTSPMGMIYTDETEAVHDYLDIATSLATQMPLA